MSRQASRGTPLVWRDPLGARKSLELQVLQCLSLRDCQSRKLSDVGGPVSTIESNGIMLYIEEFSIHRRVFKNLN